MESEKAKSDSIARQREYYLKHRDKMLAYSRKYIKDHPEKVKEYQREYYLKHRDKMLAYSRKYIKDHPEKVKEYQRRYYQKKRAAAKKEKKIMLNPDIDKAKSLFRDPSKAAHLQWLLEHNRNKSKQYESR